MKKVEEINEVRSLFDNVSSQIGYFFDENKCNKAIIGMSGGIDSSLTAALCKSAELEVVGVVMPSHVSNPQSRIDGIKACNSLHLDDVIEISIAPAFYSIYGTIVCNKKMIYSDDIVEQNIQARLRMIYLMAISNGIERSLVVNTCNLTEDLVGYATLYGDATGAIAPLGNIGKMMIYEMAKDFNKRYAKEHNIEIPEEIINKAPSADLTEGQKGEDDLPLPYSELDPITQAIKQSMEARKFNVDGYTLYAEFIRELGRVHGEEKIIEIINLMQRTEYKLKQTPPAIEISNNKFVNTCTMMSQENLPCSKCDSKICPSKKV